MKVTRGSKNRCGIFLYYDRQGIVDEYVMYLLRSIRPHLSNLLVVINGQVNEAGMEKFGGVADEVMPRNNEGFDVGGYREGIFHIGLDRLAEYDEVILFNYTFFGPLYPFKEMFDKMDDMDLDFWGITRHYKVDPDPYGVNRYGYMPEHIQSHFMAMRGEFIASEDYIEFITKLKNPASYIESICEYETIFAKHFEDLGYKWDTYVDTSEYEGYSYCPIMFYLKDMIIKQRCPIVKRRSFFTDYNDFLLNTCGEASVDAYEYIRDNLDYDVNLMWDNLLRLENISEMAKVMHFNYMLPAHEEYMLGDGKKSAVYIYIESGKHFERYINYINCIKEKADLYYIGTESGLDVLDKFNEYGKKCIISDDRYISAFREVVNNCGNYDYIGMLVMADVEVARPYSDYDSWQYSDWENLVGTGAVINNAAATFEENERLGLMAPPIPKHGNLFEIQADGWQNSFNEVKWYLDKLGINVNCKESEPPQAPFGGSFWIRAGALEKLNLPDVSVEDNIFRMALCYLVQSAGYYSGICYNNDYAAIETTNYDYMMRELNKAVFSKYGPNYHSVVVNRIENNELCVNEEQAGRRAKIKRLLDRVAKKLLPRKLYVALKMRYLKMRGWV